MAAVVGASSGGRASAGGGGGGAAASLDRARGYLSLVGVPAADLVRLARERPRLYSVSEWEALLAVPFSGRDVTDADEEALREAVGVAAVAVAPPSASSSRSTSAAVDKLREGVGRLRVQFGKGE